MYEEYVYRLYKVNMNLKSDEGLLLLTDDEKDYLLEMLNEFVDVARRITKRVKYIAYKSTGIHGGEPPEDVWKITFGEEALKALKARGLFEKVLNKEAYLEGEVMHLLKEHAQDVPNVVIAFPHYSTTHTFYRKVLTEVFGCRYASMPLFHPEMFLGPMDVDWNLVSSLSKDVSDILTEAQWVEVSSKDGTRIEFSVEHRKGIADTGLFHNRGDFGNLPAGEGFIAPVETSAYGKLTIVYGPEGRLERPLSLKFKDGAVVEMEGSWDFLENVFKKHDRARFIAEFGVGTNPKAKKVDNVLEAEKIMGTVHIAIGDNHTFGGVNKVPFHVDYVVFEPQVTVGGKGWQKRLLEKGKIYT